MRDRRLVVGTIVYARYDFQGIKLGDRGRVVAVVEDAVPRGGKPWLYPSVVFDEWSNLTWRMTSYKQALVLSMDEVAAATLAQ